MKEIAKNYNAQEFEQDIYSQWENSGLFNPDNLKTKKKHFSVALPPPNATGVLHLGHAAMLAYQDTMVRYHRMLGENTLWVPGTDHAAIATQNKVEKIIAQEDNKTKEDLGREKFLDRVKTYVGESQDTIRNQIRRMGSSVDWSRERYTFSDGLSKAVNMAFKKMYDDGLIYRGHRIVNWCPRCHSTLADDEVEYENKKTKLYWIKYGPFVLATTRPETKLGDTAVAVNPDDDRYKDMVGKDYMIPGVLGEFKVRVITDKAVDPEFGSGAVKVTPAHSFIDNEMALKNNIPMRQIIDEDGKMMANCGKYAGMTTTDAREAILKDMEKMGLIDHIDEDYEHNLSVCYRCNTPIEPLPSEQWFVDVNKKIPSKGKSLKELSINAVKSGDIDIMPDKFEKVYFNWMNNLHDWCISRQIWWGHRIPVWYKGDEKLVPRYITELIISRHGLTDWNQEGRVQGQTDTPLDEKKVGEIKDKVAQLKEEKIAKIICSPLMRSRQTAEVISEELGVDYEVDELVVERNYGSFEGKLVKDIKKDNPDYYKDKINYDIPGDEEETYESMMKRGEEFLKKVDEKYAGQKILVITHNAFIRSLEMLIKGGDAKELSDYKPLFGNFVRYSLPDGSYNLKEWEQDEDTLDTWFSSALWTFSTLLDQDFSKYSSWEEWVKNSPDLKNFHPTSVMETGYDILFFWVARMIIMTTYLLDEIPFETVYLHGLIRDKQGRKMSKSLGNGIDPIEMIDKFGADALRLSMMVGATPGNDMRLYEEKIEGYRNFVNKLWNISRYILSSVKDVKVITSKSKAKTIADEWILSELDLLVDSTTKDLDELKFSPAIERLYEFTWSKFADWYIEISKVETNKDDILLYILGQLLKLWHPFAPYVTEAIWSNFNNGQLIISQWPANKHGLFNFLKKNRNKEFNIVMDIITGIRNAKGENKLDPAKVINCKLDLNTVISSNVGVIEKLAKVKIVPTKDKSWLELHIKGVDIALDIDKSEANKMQSKQREELERYIETLQKKLGNDNFVSNAPAEVVNKEKEKLAEAEEKLNKLK
ncbi:MAG: class I tRNA ligase family protein [Candidatus Komeilibacteria bacterium]